MHKIRSEFSLITTINYLKSKVRTSFTDAIAVEDKIYLQPAEKINTYDDGEILGSIVGRIDMETMKIDYKKISPK
jgi:hypothetical protein